MAPSSILCSPLIWKASQESGLLIVELNMQYTLNSGKGKIFAFFGGGVGLQNNYSFFQLRGRECCLVVTVLHEYRRNYSLNLSAMKTSG